jgi:hypothetical protein
VSAHAFSLATVLTLTWIAGASFANNASAAEPPKAPVPKSPYIAVVYRYADTLLEKGRDPSGSFFSALDRTTLTPLTNPPSSFSTNVSSLPALDANLVRLLYFLSELTTKPKYREAADRSLRTFLQKADSAPTSSMAWDEPGLAMLWDRCFGLEPDFCHRLSFDLVNESRRTNASVREIGFSIRSWAVARARTKDTRFETAIEKAIDSVPSLLSTEMTNSGCVGAVSLAIDCNGAAPFVAEARANHLRKVAATIDELFCGLPHPLSRQRGFLKFATNDSRIELVATPQWIATPGEYTTAQVGMMCVSRYDNSARPDYLRLLLAAADSYLESLPPDGSDALPRTFGQVVSLEVAAWRHTAEPIYLERARKIADLAIEKFFGPNALPRATLKRDHYESSTGADTLALALAELHLHVLHITAVRCPPNTIDR